MYRIENKFVYFHSKKNLDNRLYRGFFLLISSQLVLLFLSFSEALTF
jgi:hypothetical protein